MNSKTIVRCSFALLVLTLVGMPSPARAQIGVSPPIFDLSLNDGPTTETARLFNYGSEPATVEVEVRQWDLDEDNQVRHLAPGESSLSQWIVINPLRFTVPAGASQAVRFSVRPRVRPTAGEHRAMIYFNEVPESPEAAARSRAWFRMGVAVYATAGERIRKGTLHDIGVDPGSLVYDLSSDGTAHVRLLGSYTIRSEDDRRAEPLIADDFPTTPVLPGTRRVFRLPLSSLEPGSYVLDFEAALGDEPLRRSLPFRIPTVPSPLETVSR